MKETQVDVAPATLAEIDELLELLERGKLIQPVDYQIFGLIEEEAHGYFSGTKTAEQAASLIQNRVELYLSE